MNHMKETLLMRIREGKLCMRSRVHFLLHNALIVLVSFLVFLCAMYLVSFGLFALDARGAFLMGTFGPQGLEELLLAMPFALLFFTLLTLSITEYLVRSFAFAYQRPILYSLGALFLLTGLGGGLLFMSNAHETLRDFSERRSVPGMRWLYHAFSDTPVPRGYPGIVRSTTTEGFILETPDGETLRVLIDDETRLPYGAIEMLGMEVFVGGERENDVIDAFGVRPLPPIHPIHKHDMKKMRKPHIKDDTRIFVTP